MPVYFTDGRKGITLISKEYEGASYLMHYRTKGSKNGQRLYQYKDGSLTPLGYIHYGIGKGRKKGSQEPEPAEKKVHGPSSEDSKRRMQGKWGDEGDPEYSRKILSKIDIPVESLSHIKKIGKNEDVAEIRKDINHRIEEGSELSNTGREFNCPNCACAFEMIERGYDVVARRAVDGSNVGDIAKNFKGGELKQASYSDWEDNPLRLQAPKSKHERKKWDRWMNEWSNELRKARDESIGKLRDELETQGAGARGIIVVGWLPDYTTDATTSFHALNYKIESDGYLTLYDSQSYRKCNGVPDLGMLYGCDPRELHYMRTDNLELNDSITQMVYSRGRGDA